MRLCWALVILAAVCIVNLEEEGRRGGFLSTAGSFTLASGNRAGSSERLKGLEDLGGGHKKEFGNS